jgi:uncharacterized protein (DUF433 family)
MIATLPFQFVITQANKQIETYTLSEAIEIARRLVHDSSQEIQITDHMGVIKARVFPHGDEAYVDYYLSECIAQCEFILHGKPRIASGRIPVQMILDLLAADVPIETIISDEYYPDLTRADVLACIAYASSLLRTAS